MLIPVLLIVLVVQWLCIIRMHRAIHLSYLALPAILIAVYGILRLAGFYSRFIWIDIFIFSCGSILTGFLIRRKFRNKTLLQPILVALTLVVVNFALLLNGFITSDRWIWDNSVQFRIRTKGGNVVALNGIDWGGQDYVRYSFRRELFGGAFFREYDEVKAYGNRAGCFIKLKNNLQEELLINTCKKKIEP